MFAEKNLMTKKLCFFFRVICVMFIVFQEEIYVFLFVTEMPSLPMHMLIIPNNKNTNFRPYNEKKTRQQKNSLFSFTLSNTIHRRTDFGIFHKMEKSDKTNMIRMK